MDNLFSEVPVVQRASAAGAAAEAAFSRFGDNRQVPSGLNPIMRDARPFVRGPRSFS